MFKRCLKILLLCAVLTLAVLAQPRNVKILIRASAAPVPNDTKSAIESKAPLVGNFRGFQLECNGHWFTFISQADLQSLAGAFGAQVVLNSSGDKIALSFGSRKSKEKSLVSMGPKADLPFGSFDVGKIDLKGQRYFELTSSLGQLLMVPYIGTENPAGQLNYIVQGRVSR